MNKPSPEDYRKVCNDWIVSFNELRRLLGYVEQPLWTNPPTEQDILNWKISNPILFAKFEEQVYKEMNHRLELEKLSKRIDSTIFITCVTTMIILASALLYTGYWRFFK